MKQKLFYLYIIVFAWTHRKLGEVTTKIGSGKTPKGGSSVYLRHGIPLLRSQNITNDAVDLSDVVYISDEMDSEMANSRVQIKDVLLNITGASIGRSAVYTHTTTANVNQHVCIVRPTRDVNAEYLQLNLTSPNGQQQIDNSQAGGGREGLNFQQIAKIEFHFPTLPEQTAIGTFFRTLDDIIAATQRKVAGLKQLKAAYLQQMFPQAGERVPRVRFGGFTGDWEIRTIESFADVKTGGKDTQDAISNGEYDFYVRSPKIEKINSYSFDGEAVLTVGDGVGVGKVFHYVNGKFDYHQRVYKISDFNDVYGLFFYQYFAANFIKESQKYNAKTSVDSVRREMITKMLIPCPTIEEQITIGDFFHNLDTQITAQSEKAKKLKQLKSAYLQKMFI